MSRKISNCTSPFRKMLSWTDMFKREEGKPDNAVYNA
jgi:hypothetical protein